MPTYHKSLRPLETHLDRTIENRIYIRQLGKTSFINSGTTDSYVDVEISFEAAQKFLNLCTSSDWFLFVISSSSSSRF